MIRSKTAIAIALAASAILAACMPEETNDGKTDETTTVAGSAFSAELEAARLDAIEDLRGRYQDKQLRKDASASIVAPALNGLRVKVPGQAEIYLIDQGVRRHIPNPDVFNRLFRDWGGIQEAYWFALVDVGPPLSTESALLSPFGGGPVYLVEPGVKRWIVSPAVMDKYNFSWGQIIAVPPFLLSSVATGPNID